MPEKLTARRIETLKPPTEGRIELTDTVARGLVFRLTAAGSASWSLSIKVNGRQRRFPIGDYPAMSLADARVAAGKLRAEARAGADPIAEKRSELAERAAMAALSVGVVLDRYAELHLSKLADGKRREAQLRAALAKRLAAPMAQLTRADLQAMVDAKGVDAPVAANRLAAALSHFATWSRRRGYITDAIGAEISKPTRERARERVLSLEEVGAIWRASLALDPLWGGFLRLLILTAQRRGDVAGMRWREIDGTRWSIPGERTKNRRPHIVHLAAAGDCRSPSHQGRRGALDGLVFTTTGRTPVSGFGRVKKRLDALCGVADWTLHDLRTAFASHCAEAGIAEGVVDRVLNHAASASSASAVARVYQRSELLPQRAEALRMWAEMVMRASTEVPPSKLAILNGTHPGRGSANDLKRSNSIGTA